MDILGYVRMPEKHSSRFKKKKIEIIEDESE